MNVRRVIPVLSALLLSAACATSGATTASCGDSNRQKPIVCVNDGVMPLELEPEPVHAHDRTRLLGRPVLMQWRTASGSGDLQVKFKEEGCVSDVRCDGRGKCRAKTIRLQNDTSKHCAYDVWIVGKTEPLDPNVVIVKCCATASD